MNKRYPRSDIVAWSNVGDWRYYYCVGLTRDQILVWRKVKRVRRFSPDLPVSEDGLCLGPSTLYHYAGSYVSPWATKIIYKKLPVALQDYAVVYLLMESA